MATPLPAHAHGVHAAALPSVDRIAQEVRKGIDI
jgi:hypothetical protein